jgi:hypothetical protein
MTLGEGWMMGERALRSGRIVRIAGMIGVGLALRRFGYDLGLPFLVVKYGGSVLWGAMVYLALAALLNSTRAVPVIAFAVGIAASVEFSRLYHTPWLDEFRLTTAGALLLGRVFSLWNILAYVAGIVTAAFIDRRLARSKTR